MKRLAYAAMAAAMFASAAAQTSPKQDLTRAPLVKPPVARLAMKPQDQSADFKTARVAAQAVSVRLDKVFYETGDLVEASVRFAKLDPKADRFVVFVVSGLKDVEAVVVKKTGPRQYETERSNARLAPPSGAPAPHDGKLESTPGDRIVGLVFFDQKETPVGANVVADLAIVGTNGAQLPAIRVLEKGMSEDEKAALQSGVPFGALYAEGDVPLEIALGEMMFTPNGVYDLKSFLEYSGGKVTGQSGNAKQAAIDGGAVTYLVSVPLGRARVDRLADLRALFGENDKLAASQAGALQTAALIHEFRLKGFAVAANPRLQQHGVFATTETASGATTSSPGALVRAMSNTDSAGRLCAPGDTACPMNTPRLWAHMALWDLDTRTVPVAFLDQGFATASPDFRRPATGLVECDFERLGAARCAPGAANGLPIVRASGVGDFVWHGTGSITVAGGVLNNGWTPGGGASGFSGGSAGVAGQVMTPMLYRLGIGSYAFRTGEAIRRAVDDGAACINVPAGYPCNLRLTLVGDFDYCNPGTRAAACAIIIGATATATAAATGAACAASGLFSFLDVIVPGLGTTLGATTCGAATVAATTALVAATTGCTAIVALGDVSGPMRAGVDYATARGVPIIASAGNRFTADMVPAEVRPIIDPATLAFDADRLRIIPATLPNVIAVGAASVTDGGGWTNSQIRGASVLVWGPEHANYITPPIGGPLPTGPAGFTAVRTHGGTSGASSFVAGVVAAMQAANPQLNPRTPGLTAAQRAAIVGQVRTNLSATATNLGTGTAEPARLLLVNPWAAVQRAWGAWPTGFENAMNFNETGADDTSAGARRIGAGRHPGTIITVPGSGGAATLRDTDFYRMIPTGGGSGSTFRLTLRYPERLRGVDAGHLELAGSGWTETDSRSSSSTGSSPTVTRSKTYTSGTVSSTGSGGVFQIRGVGDDDNVYELSIEEFPIRPADRFDRDDSGNLAASRPNNNLASRAVPIGSARGLPWATSGSGVTSIHRLAVPSLSFHNADDVDWFIFDAYPAPGSVGSGRCEVRTLSIRRLGNVEFRFGEELVAPSRYEGGRFYLQNPPEGLLMRATRASGASITEYELDIEYTALLTPSLGGRCP